MYLGDPTIRCIDLCIYLRLGSLLYTHPVSRGRSHGFE